MGGFRPLFPLAAKQALYVKWLSTFTTPPGQVVCGYAPIVGAGKVIRNAESSPDTELVGVH